MKFGVALAFACLLATVVFAATQDRTVEPSALDRTIPEDPFGTAFLLEPPLPQYTVAEALGVARAAGIPIGFESVRGDGSPESRRFNEAAKSRKRVPLGGKTVREALDIIVARDPRYLWFDMEGVPVVRPIEAWVDPHNPLNTTLGDVNWDGATFSTVLSAVFTALSGLQHQPSPSNDPPVSLRLRSASVLDVLNAVARADRKARWRATYNCTDRIRDALLIQFDMFPEENGGAFGVGSCASYKPMTKGGEVGKTWLHVAQVFRPAGRLQD